MANPSSSSSKGSTVGPVLLWRGIDPDVPPPGDLLLHSDDLMNEGFWLLKRGKNDTYQCKFCGDSKTTALARAKSHFTGDGGWSMCLTPTVRAREFRKKCFEVATSKPRKKLKTGPSSVATQQSIATLFDKSKPAVKAVEAALVSFIAGLNLPFSLCDHDCFINLIRILRESPRVPVPSGKVIGGRALQECADSVLKAREVLLSDVMTLGGWIIADGQTLGRLALNNSALLSFKGVLFLRSVDAKGVTKNAVWLLSDLVEAMSVVRKNNI